jgi:hypothetical protein
MAMDNELEQLRRQDSSNICYAGPMDVECVVCNKSGVQGRDMVWSEPKTLGGRLVIVVLNGSLFLNYVSQRAEDDLHIPLANEPPVRELKLPTRNIFILFANQ